MKNMFLILMPLMVLATSVNAYDVEGIVYDYDRKFLVDATIRLLTIQRVEAGRDVTNSRGEYRIKGIQAGSYTMEITKMGMKKETLEIGVGGPIYQATIYKDVYLYELIRFESVKPSELKGLFMTGEEEIPVSAFSSYMKGVKKLEKKKYKSAMKDFQRALKRYPPFSRCYTHIGEIHVIEGRTEDARTAFLKAIELNEGDPMPRAAMGKLLSETGDFEKALPYLTTALELDSARAEIYFLLGKAQFHQGMLPETEKNLLQGLMLQPRESGDARLILAEMYYAEKRYSESRDMLSAYLRNNPFAEDKEKIRVRIKEIEDLMIRNASEDKSESD